MGSSRLLNDIGNLPAYWGLHSQPSPYAAGKYLQQTPSLHWLHIRDATTQKVLILLLQEIKRDIIFHHAQLQEP